MTERTQFRATSKAALEHFLIQAQACIARHIVLAAYRAACDEAGTPPDPNAAAKVSVESYGVCRYTLCISTGVLCTGSVATVFPDRPRFLRQLGERASEIRACLP